MFAGGDVIEPFAEIGKCPVRESGTEAAGCGPTANISNRQTTALSSSSGFCAPKPCCCPGVVVSLSRPVKTQTEPFVRSWHYPDGLKGYLDNLISEAQEAVPIFASENYFRRPRKRFQRGQGAAFALTWLEEGSAANESYVNLIPTPLGSTHEAGLKQAVFNAVNNFITHHNLLPRGVKVQSDDVFSKVAFVLSARVLDPAVSGADPKEKLTNRDALKLVAAVSGDPLELWLNQNIEAGKFAELAIKQAQARDALGEKNRKAQRQRRGRVARQAHRLRKRRHPRKRIVFSGRRFCRRLGQTRARQSHPAILPLRGKVLNSFETHRDQLFGNAESTTFRGHRRRPPRRAR